MIRLYEVVFDHKEYGDNYCAATVAVEGDALAAIDKALRGEPKHANGQPFRRQLTVREVRLQGEESRGGI